MKKKKIDYLILASDGVKDILLWKELKFLAKNFIENNTRSRCKGIPYIFFKDDPWGLRIGAFVGHDGKVVVFFSREGEEAINNHKELGLLPGQHRQ